MTMPKTRAALEDLASVVDMLMRAYRSPANRKSRFSPTAEQTWPATLETFCCGRTPWPT
jgi:hypothetical protein